MGKKIHVCPKCKKSYKTEKGLVLHIRYSHPEISTEKFYIEYKLNGVEPTCGCGCGEKTNFVSWKDGFNTYVNGHHAKHISIIDDKKEIITCKHCGDEFEALKSENRMYCSKSCSSKATIESSIDVLKSKYGENYLQSEHFSSKRKQTNIERYGSENPFGSKEVQEKIKQTNIQKFGVEYPAQNDVIKEKIKKSTIDSIGVPYAFIIDENRERGHDTKKMKYIDRILSSDIFKTKYKALFSKDEYKGIYHFYPFECLTCGNTFEANFNSILPYCKVCVGENRSQIENNILGFINDVYNGRVLENRRDIIAPYELDIYIPEKKIAIEINGNYYHTEANGKDKNYHITKTKMCKDIGIKLIHIFEDEILFKEDIVKSRIKNMLGISEKSIYGRKTNVVKIDKSEEITFFEHTHTQGYSPSKVCYALEYEGEIVSAMSFSKPRFSSSKDDEYEIVRFSSTLRVVGGASKLFSAFLSEFSPSKVISFADLRWGDGNVYEHMGFQLVDQTKPNYWYVNTKNYLVRHNRVNFQKHKLKDKLEFFDHNLTEWENMQINGYDRIWDCGNLKYVYKKGEPL